MDDVCHTNASREACNAARGLPGGVNSQYGAFDPNGVINGYRIGADFFLNTATGQFFVFNGAPRSNTGWVDIAGSFGVQLSLFGPDPTGATSSDAAFALALAAAEDRGGGIIDIGVGRYKFDVPWVVPPTIGLNLAGEGRDSTILDFTSINNSNGAIYATGSLESLGLLASNVAVGDMEVEFVDPPDLEPGDVYMIFDTANGSYNPSTAHYKAGEYFYVASVSGTTVTNTTRAYAAYASGGTRVLKKLIPGHFSARGMTMLFRQGVSNPGIKASLCNKIHFEDLDLSGSRYAQIYIDRCFDFSIDHVWARDYQAGVGLNYGVLVSNSQMERVSNCMFQTSRHGLSHGGGAEDGCIPYRDVLIDNSHIGSSSDQMYGLDFHSNGEHCQISNCSLPAGSNASADHLLYSNCKLYGNVFGEAFFQASGALGANYHFDNCTFFATMEMTNNCLVSLLSDSQLVRPSITNFTNCHFQFRSFLADSGATFGVLWLEGVSAVSNDITLKMVGCDADSDTTANTPLYAIGVRPQSTLGIKSVIIKSNEFKKAGIWLDGNIQNLTCDENTILDALDSGVRANNLATPSFATQHWSTCGNKIYRSKKTGMFLELEKTAHVLDCKDNTSINNIQGGTTGSTLTDSSIYIFQAKRVNLEGNTFGDDQSAPTQTRGFAINDCDVVMERDNEVYGGLANVKQTITTERYRGSVTVDLGSIADGATGSTNVTVPGVALGDKVAGACNFSLPSGVSLVAFVTGTDTVRVSLINNTGAPYDPPSATYTVLAMK